MLKYLIIDGTDVFNYINSIQEILAEQIPIYDSFFDNEQLIILTQFKSDINFETIATSIIEELYINIRIFVSQNYVDEEIQGSIDFFRTKIPLYHETKVAFDIHDLIINNLLSSDNDLHFILKKYYYDIDMKNFIFNYLDNNMNVLKTASKSYFHRNTINNKITNFKNVTGFDLHLFKDCFSIYYLLRK
jgi:hypothetical protein